MNTQALDRLWRRKGKFEKLRAVIASMAAFDLKGRLRPARDDGSGDGSGFAEQFVAQAIATARSP